MTRCVLRDLIDVSLDGEWGQGESGPDLTPMLCIRGTDFAAARLGDLSGVPRRHIVTRKADRKALQPWDILIEVAGGTKTEITGRTLLMRPVHFESSDDPLTCASFSRFIRVRRSLCDPRFLFWLLQHMYASGAMHAYHTQHTGVARFQWTTFAEREPLDVPSHAQQERIAGILSAYDDLIENCERRIRVLDEMARALYREWFVDFRFPGHERATIVDSVAGRVPRGWEVRPVAECFETLGGGTPARKDAAYWEAGTVPWYSPTDLTAAGSMFMDKSGECITDLGLAKSSAKLFPAMCVMMTSRATIGAIAINTTPACTNQGFITCIPSERMPVFLLFHWLRENVPLFQRMASGATFKEISRGVFRGIELALPPRDLALKFDSLVHPMAEETLVLQRQRTNLRQTRDLLLPRLLSGQLSVDDAA
jgi:type I restriction enzyme, S subunit